MPNGDQEDTRKLWERVRDMERTVSHLSQENHDLRIKAQTLDGEKGSLLEAIRMLKSDPA